MHQVVFRHLQECREDPDLDSGGRPRTGFRSTVIADGRTDRDTGKAAQEKIIVLLREHPELTRKTLAARIGITPDSVGHHLDSLKKTGRVHHAGPMNLH